MMANHQLINVTSGEQEYFTPLPIVDAARRVMGSIALDPASSTLANERIKAEVDNFAAEFQSFGIIKVRYGIH